MSHEPTTPHAVPLSFRSMGVRYDGVERYLVRYSDGSIREHHDHVSEHAPYYHFGRFDQLTQPPHYDARLQEPTS